MQGLVRGDLPTTVSLTLSLIGRLGCPQLAWSRLDSGGVGGYFHDEVGVEGQADPFQQWDGGHDTACFQAG